MALQEAHGQTDVMNDPRYLATLRGRAGEQARAAYETRQNQAARLAQQRAEFNIRQQQTAETGRTTAQDREDKQRALEEYRRHQMGLRQDAQTAAKMEQLRQFITTPPTGTPPSEVENAKNQYYAFMGIPRGLTPQQEAENKLRAAKGQPLIQPPGAGTPGGPQFPAVGTPGAAPVSTGGAAPTAAPPERQNFGIGSSIEYNVQRAVAGEQTSAPYYNPRIGANVVRTQSGREVVVGAPDPSVGAAETAVRTPLVGGGEQLNFPSGGIARSGVAGETRAARALREPMFAPSGVAGGAAPTTPTAPTTPGAQPQKQTTAATTGGGAGTPGGGGPAKPELQPYGQPTQFHFDALGKAYNALAGLYTKFPGEQQPQPQQPPPFAPGSLAPGGGAAAPTSPAQQPPPLGGPPGAGTPPIRPLAPTML